MIGLQHKFAPPTILSTPSLAMDIIVLIVDIPIRLVVLFASDCILLKDVHAY